ncbi:MAG: branched-chain amino acid ABC transporter permease [Dehalobacterium sp.]
MSKNLSKFKWPLILIILLLVPFLVTSKYNMHLIIMAGIYAIMAIGLDIIMGYTGQLSLAHQSFYGIGAYVSALLTLRLGWSVWFGMVAAILATLLVSYLVGYISLRVRGTTFIILTFSFSGIAHLVALNYVELTNGQMGLSSIPMPSIGGFTFGSRMSYYYLVLFFLVITYYIAVRLTKSRLGRSWIGIRENEILAESLGVNPFHYSLFAFMIGSSLAGFAGALYAHYTCFVSPENLQFGVVITLLVMVVLGGKGTIIGPVIGAVIFTVVPEYLRIAEDLRLPIFGILLVILALYIPKGLIPFCQDLLAKKRQKKEVPGNEAVRG